MTARPRTPLLALFALSACTTELGNWRPSDINDEDVIVGTRTGAANASRAVRYRGRGPVEDLPALPGDTSTTATGITNGGTVAGTSGTSAVLWDPSGAVRVVPRLRDLRMSALAANDRGVLVGVADTEDFLGEVVPWVFDVTTGELSELAFPHEFQAALPTGINDAGEIVGYAYAPSTSGIFHAAHWSADSHAFSLLPLPPGESGASRALGINAPGTIVGEIHGRAALWPPNGDPVLLPTGRCSDGAATAINDAGVVIGQLTGGVDGCDPAPSSPTSPSGGLGGPRPPPTFAVRWNAGSDPIDMGPPYSFATAINGNDVAVGYGDLGALRWPPDTL